MGNLVDHDQVELLAVVGDPPGLNRRGHEVHQLDRLESSQGSASEKLRGRDRAQLCHEVHQLIDLVLRHAPP